MIEFRWKYSPATLTETGIDPAPEHAVEMAYGAWAVLQFREGEKKAKKPQPVLSRDNCEHEPEWETVWTEWQDVEIKE